MRSIREFLSRRHILLTGGTGFLGKALLEKILRAVPEVGRIYLLVRPSRRADGSVLTPAERVRRDVFETAIFSRLRQEHGERFWSFLDEKIVVLAGDLTDPDLGLDAAGVELLRANVDIVVHGAASVFFDERIDRAVAMNSLGPRRLVELTRTFRKQAIFAFVSTAYVSGVRRGVVPEELPEPGRSAAQLAGLPNAPGLDVERELEEIAVFTREVLARADTPQRRAAFAASARAAGGDGGESAAAETREAWVTRELVQEGMRRARRLGWHEVYTFTKAMGEALVFQARGDLPVALVRPSIIESSLSEPEPGWINGLKVADPLIAGYAKGRIPDFPGDREAFLDLIPVDFVANAILGAIEQLDRDRKTTVYHVATSARNPIRVGQVFELLQSYYRRHPMRDKRGEPIRTPDWRFPKLASFEARYRWLYQKPLGFALAAVRATSFLPWPAGLAAKLERSLDGIAKLLYYVDIYGPYTSLLASYQSDNTKRLFDGLTAADKRDFNFDVEAISWPNYIQDIHLSGLDRHVLRFGGAQVGRRGKRGGRMSTEDLRALPDLLRMSAERFADKVALQVKREDAWVRVTYRDLLRRSGLVGARWRKGGLTRGARVVLISENQPEWCIAYMALQSVGATVVPIDVHTPADEVQEIVDFVAASAVVASEDSYATLPKSLLSSSLPIWNLNAEGAVFADRPGAVAMPDAAAVKWEELGPDDIASIIFTSGPAVEPRGVMLSHRNFLANLLALAEVLRSYETDRFLSVLPLHHALEFTGGLLMPLLSGATVTYAQSLKSNVILSAMRETGATALLAVPRIFEMLLDRLRRSNEGYAPGERNPEFDSFVNQVRLLVSGGAALDFSIYEGFAELGFSIHEGYGLTETAPILTVNPLWAVRPRSVGKPLPGVELRLDERPGEDPEIVVRGPNVMSGYYNNPEATARVLKDGWLHTGDLGRLDSDGYLTITGRSKELIVTGAGKNVWPEEVEFFYRAIPGVEEIVVFGVREPGATRETVHAAVIAKAEPERVLEAIHRVASERPSYQRIQQIHFWTAPIPRLASDASHPDRRALRDAAIEILRTKKLAKRAARLPSREEPWWQRDTLALLGRIAVRTPDEIVSPRDSLTQLFDSLQMLELATAMEARFGVTVRDAEIESLRTVADVLARVKAEVGDRPEPPPGEFDEPLESDYWGRILAGADASAALPGVAASPAFAPGRRLVLALSNAILRTIFRLSVRGLDRLPQRVPFLIAANHSSHLDTFAIVAALRSKVRRVHVLGAKDYFFDSAIKSWFFRNFFNVVPFDREKNFLEGFRAARQVLRVDEPLLLFPEGTRSPNGRLQPFKVGLGILALELGAAVVPARIRGAFEAMPKGRYFPKPGRIEIAIGEAVSMEPYLERRGSVNTYALYREVVNTVRQRVDQLVEQA